MNITNLSGPIVGAIIGYGTNWLAIKMLFRPLKPIKIGNFTLPLTPGIIPKRKDKLAKAMGNSVGNHLFTTEDMAQMLLSEEVENTIVNGILVHLDTENTVKDLLEELFHKQKYYEMRENVKELISEKIQNGLLQMQIGEMIAQTGGQVIREKVKGSMLRMFVTDGLIDSILEPMSIEIENYVKEHGKEKIMPILEPEINSFENTSIKDLLESLDEIVIRDIYRRFVSLYVKDLLDKLDISRVVEEKINNMDVKELEKLLLSIMKKELGTIVNLGALIGLILGSLNMWL